MNELFNQARAPFTRLNNALERTPQIGSELIEKLPGTPGQTLGVLAVGAITAVLSVYIQRKHDELEFDPDLMDMSEIDDDLSAMLDGEYDRS